MLRPVHREVGGRLTSDPIQIGVGLVECSRSQNQGLLLGLQSGTLTLGAWEFSPGFHAPFALFSGHSSWGLSLGRPWRDLSRLLPTLTNGLPALATPATVA